MSEPPPIDPSTRRRPLSRQLVIDTAARIANERGLDALTLTAVADELGVRQPALYRHVDGYDDVMRSLGLHGRERLADALASAAIGLARDDAVIAMGRAWRWMAVEHPGLYAATDRSPCAGDRELEAAVHQVIGVVAQALVGYELDTDQRMSAATALRSAFHGFAHLEAGDGHPLTQSLDDSFAGLIEVLCAGIRSHERRAADQALAADLGDEPLDGAVGVDG